MVLVYYDLDMDLYFVCDVLLYGIGVVLLYKYENGSEWLIVYILKILIKVEWNYV